jgi:hypothetical protein
LEKYSGLERWINRQQASNKSDGKKIEVADRTGGRSADNSALLNAIVADSSKTGMMLLMDAAQPYVGLDLIIGVESSVGPSNAVGCGFKTIS